MGHNCFNPKYLSLKIYGERKIASVLESIGSTRYDAAMEKFRENEIGIVTLVTEGFVGRVTTAWTILRHGAFTFAVRPENPNRSTTCVYREPDLG